MSEVNGMEKLRAICTTWEPVGSRVTCNPIPVDADIDILALLSPIHKLIDACNLVTTIECGFEYGGSVSEDKSNQSMRFVSLKRGKENIILTTSEEFAKRFLAATHVAKNLNLLNKEDRIMLFQAVLYGNKYNTDDNKVNLKPKNLYVE